MRALSVLALAMTMLAPAGATPAGGLATGEGHVQRAHANGVVFCEGPVAIAFAWEARLGTGTLRYHALEASGVGVGSPLSNPYDCRGSATFLAGQCRVEVAGVVRCRAYTGAAHVEVELLRDGSFEARHYIGAFGATDAIEGSLTSF